MMQEVEKFVRPSYIDRPNVQNETPTMVFTREHEKLVVAGGEWMKHTSNSCTIAAALIATVVFAAIITVPGGNDGSNGLPIFSKEIAFTVFIISDALSLFTSTTSLLLFLSILTARYAEGDFLHVLPKRLIIGLVTLFLSITTMMVAFSSTLCLVFRSLWISSLQHTAMEFLASKVIDSSFEINIGMKNSEHVSSSDDIKFGVTGTAEERGQGWCAD
ncbi:hypothetical protein RHSIM_Rhsim05G0008600 [Rhododendron simsii]|uniref:PGG domain-containing protein n=1 Tax=Rhododendron simsii TaxID=118357 RepID=A0A834H1D5_RHOSS|nr:hypothetical protein RHSIM_Rhsim05G0008600 [Rhododendron simsii]